MNERLRREGLLNSDKIATKTDATIDAPEQAEQVPRQRRVLVTPTPTLSETRADDWEGTIEEVQVARGAVASWPGASEAGTGGAAASAATAKATEDQRAPLFAPNEANELRGRWDSVQVSFVDQPRKAVEDADELVSVTMKRLEEIFAEEREKMEKQWSAGADASTEDYRVALRRYRSFFTRLLSI